MENMNFYVWKVEDKFLIAIAPSLEKAYELTDDDYVEIIKNKKPFQITEINLGLGITIS